MSLLAFRRLKRSQPSYFLFASLLLTALAACSSSTVNHPSDFQKVMAALGPSPLFAGLEPRNRWMIVGNPATDQLTLVRDEGLPVALVKAAQNDLIVGRRVDQHLLATPYLTWAWKMSPHSGPHHPVRLIVGFADGPKPPIGRDRTLRSLPDGVRVMELVWDEKALRRGIVTPPEKNGAGLPARYTVRGGEEALGKRWSEGVDLISLHDRVWPGLSTRDTRIIFVAVRARPYRGQEKRTRQQPAALISEIRLIR